MFKPTPVELETMWVRMLPFLSSMQIDGIEETREDFLRQLGYLIERAQAERLAKNFVAIGGEGGN